MRMRYYILLAILVAAGLYLTLRSLRPSPDPPPPTYTVGLVSIGEFSFPIRADSSSYAIPQTIHVEAITLRKAEPTTAARMGTPEHFVVHVGGGKALLLSAFDLYDRKIRLENGKKYRIVIGRRCPLHAAFRIWNVVAVAELNEL